MEAIKFKSMHWNWTDMCPEGLTPWIADTNDLGFCFQQICLQLPILILISIVSAFHFGRRTCLVARNKVQIRLIYLRVFIVLFLGFIPLIKTYFMITKHLQVYPADILVSCAECVTWIVHLGFLLSMRSHGGLSHRGPLFLGVLLTSFNVLACVWLRTSFIYSIWAWAAVRVGLLVLYGISLFPTGKAIVINRRNTEEDERQALLGNTYIRFQTDIDDGVLGAAQDGTRLISRLIFYWVSPLIEKGVLGDLKKIDDLFDLPDCLSIIKISEKLQKSIDGTRSLFWALHRSFGREFYLVGLLRLIGDLSGFAGPLLLGGMLRTENTGSDGKPYLYALGLFGATLLSAFCSTHFNWKISLVTMKMRTGLVTAIYRKTLEARGLQGARPDVLNLMSTDTDRIVNSCVSFHSLWSIPFQLFATLYLLYTQVGAAFIAGLIFAIALIPINRYIAVQIGFLSQGLMTEKDGRVSATSEALAGAKQIKLNSWEGVFINKIQNLRIKELKFLAKRKYLDALCVYFWATTPVLMCLLTFGTTVLTGNDLTAATTYTSVALLNMLIGPLNAFPWVLNGLTEAWVSLKRVQELINLPNIDLSTYYSPNLDSTPKNRNSKRTIILIENASFEYQFLRSTSESNLIQENIENFKLVSMNLEIKQGELVCLEGQVGGGKSSFLSAILGDLTCTEGSIFVHDFNSGFGYISQNIWMQRGTIRENILWGSVYDESRYKKVLLACALQEDLEILGGDLIGVGESGRTLSGGQRARVALARSVYQDKKIYLLDDVLSSVDAHVAAHIIKYCILGLLENKTRIIVTENKTILNRADQIFHVENGSITKADVFNNSDDEDEDEENLSIASFNSITLIEEDKKSLDSILINETKEQGNLSTSVILAYWKATTGILGFLVLLSVVVMQVTRNLSDAWLAYWVSQTNLNKTNDLNQFLDESIFFLQSDNTLNYYLGIYAGMAITNSLVTLVRSFIFAYAGMKAAKYVHDKLLNSVFYTKFKFFDITPLGRILNRFSSDTYTIDDSLPFILNILLAQLAGLIGSLSITLYAMPWIGLLVVPLCPIYLNLQSRYRHASRDIKRLSSNSLSPIYAHFTETLQGLTTIRAMRGSNRFRRDFSVKLEESIRAQLTSTAAQQWLGLRLQFLGAVLVGGAGLLAAVTSAHATNPSYVGLAISYALSITGLLGGVLNALAETEQEFVAVERVNQYCRLEKEPNVDGSASPPFGWPCQGVVSFQNVYMSYREHLSPVLCDINFTTEGFERVGIVGRTGAGKSSILSSLLRVAPVSRGTITLDCVNIATLSLGVLRNRISVVPQDPFLFSGTVRENLDPTELHLDSEIWTAISNCLVSALIQSLGGLDARLDTGGSNLSAGQKQLLCLTRALLKNSKVVLIDEGTSNLDSESDAAIQSVIRNSFKSSTVLIIAHKLNGLQYANRILVMDNGYIIESGTPRKLAADKNSLFSGMLHEQNNKTFS